MKYVQSKQVNASWEYAAMQCLNDKNKYLMR